VDAVRAAGFLSLSPRRVLALARSGAIPAHPLRNGQRRVWRFRLSELASAVGARRVQSVRQSHVPIRRNLKWLKVVARDGVEPLTQPLVTHEEPLLNERPAIDALLRRLRPDEKLFGTLTKQNANYRFAKYAKLAGLPKHKRHTHCLRHSRAMHTIKTAGIENVRQLCGHASIASTGYYLKVSDASAWAALGSGAGL
jgi:site-specific recombinase XerD